VACAFDLLMHDGDDLRRRPFRERKLALAKLRQFSDLGCRPSMTRSVESRCP
jgi:ATP-dependent DNA ligase